MHVISMVMTCKWVLAASSDQSTGKDCVTISLHVTSNVVIPIMRLEIFRVWISYLLASIIIGVTTEIQEYFKMKIGYANVRSLNTTFNFVETACNKQHIQILGLSEIWHPDKTVKDNVKKT